MVVPGRVGGGEFTEPRVVLVGIVDGEENGTSSGLTDECYVRFLRRKAGRGDGGVI